MACRLGCYRGDFHTGGGGRQVDDALCSREGRGRVPVPGECVLLASWIGQCVFRACAGPAVQVLISSFSCRAGLPQAPAAERIGLLPWRGQPHILPLSALIQYLIKLDSL